MSVFSMDYGCVCTIPYVSCGGKKVLCLFFGVKTLQEVILSVVSSQIQNYTKYWQSLKCETVKYRHSLNWLIREVRMSTYNLHTCYGHVIKHNLWPRPTTSAYMGQKVVVINCSVCIIHGILSVRTTWRHFHLRFIQRSLFPWETIRTTNVLWHY